MNKSIKILIFYTHLLIQKIKSIYSLLFRTYIFINKCIQFLRIRLNLPYLYTKLGVLNSYYGNNTKVFKSVNEMFRYFMYQVDTKEKLFGFEGVYGNIKKNFKNFFYVYENAFVFGGTKAVYYQNKFIHDDYFNLIKYKSSEHTKYPFVKIGNNYLVKYKSPGILRRFDSGIYLNNEYNENYFHFIFETLPKLIAIRNSNVDNEIPIMLQSNLHENIKSIVNLVSNQRKVIYLNKGSFYNFKVLYTLPEYSLIVDDYYAAKNVPLKLNFDFIDPFIDIVTKKYINEKHSKIKRKFPKKIFFSRADSIRSSRFLMNKKNLQDISKINNFKIVSLNSLTIEEQFLLCKNANHFIFESGAALSNMIFMNKGSKVIVLINNHFANQKRIWIEIARRMEVDLVFIEGKIRLTSYLNKYGVHAPYKIDEEIFKKNITLSS